MSPESVQHPSVCPQCGAASTSVCGSCASCLATVAFLDDDPVSPSADVAMDRLTQLGPYLLIEEIGRGGMGVVYRATQAGLDRDVALKVIAAGPLADPELLIRFRNEARMVGQLRHPHIVAIHDVGETDGFAYFSMELIIGPTLAHRVRTSGPLSEADAVAVMEKIAGALAQAHGQGILHRDLKPSNILLDIEGEPYVADFGLGRMIGTSASAADLRAELTLTHQSLGTPAWLAPEQASSEHGDVTERTDLHGLGALLYFCLTGRPPFPGRTVAELLDQVRHFTPTPPRLLDPSLSADVETLVLRCLEKEPHRRLGSVGVLREELARIREGRPILSRPVRPWVKAWRWAQRRKALAAALVALGGVVVTATVALSWLWIQARDAAVAEKQQRQVAEEQLWNSLLESARGHRLSGAFEARSTVLGIVQKAASMKVTTEVRDQALAALTMPEIKSQPKVTSTDDLAGQVVPSVFHPHRPEGVLMHRDGRIMIYRLEDGGLIEALQSPRADHPHSVRFSSGGHWLMAVHTREILLWRSGGEGEPSPSSPRPLIRVRCSPLKEYEAWDVSQDGRWLVGLDRGQVAVFSLPAGKLSQTFVCPASTDVWISPDGSWLMLCRDALSRESKESEALGPQLYARGPDGSYELKATLPGDTRRGVVAWSRDSRQLVWSDVRNKLSVYDLQQLRLRHVLSGHDGYLTEVKFIHQDQWLLSTGWDRCFRLWDSALGTRLLTFPHGGASMIDEASSLLYYQNTYGRVLRAQVTVPQTVRVCVPTETADEQPAAQLCFHPDGRHLMTAHDSAVCVWDLTARRVVQRVAGALSVGISASGDAVFAASDLGVVRYPLGSSPELKLGPPQPLPPLGLVNHLALSEDGTSHVAAYDLFSHRGGHRRQMQVCRGQQVLARWTADAFYPRPAISAGGEWIATGGHQNCRVVLWDGRTGEERPFQGSAEELQDLESQQGASVAVSANGGLVAAVTPQSVSLWETATQRRAHHLPRPPLSTGNAAAFSPDSQLLATSGSPQQIWLIHAPTGQRVAALESPHSALADGLTFSRDGRQLAAGLTGGGVIVWHLAELRAQLAQLGLDWADGDSPGR